MASKCDRRCNVKQAGPGRVNARLEARDGTGYQNQIHVCIFLQFHACSAPTSRLFPSCRAVSTVRQQRGTDTPKPSLFGLVLYRLPLPGAPGSRQFAAGSDASPISMTSWAALGSIRSKRPGPVQTDTAFLRSPTRPHSNMEYICIHTLFAYEI